VNLEVLCDSRGLESSGGPRGLGLLGGPRGLELLGGPRGLELLGGPRGLDLLGGPRGLDLLGGPLGLELLRLLSNLADCLDCTLAACYNVEKQFEELEWTTGSGSARAGIQELLAGRKEAG